MSGDSKQDNRLAFLGALAGGLAHEIKNPLSTIGMNLQLLQEDWEHPESDRERRLVRKLGVLSREVERLESILDDFLRFAGEHKLERRPSQISALVEDVLEFLSPKLGEKGIEVRSMLAEDLPALSLDRDAMKQVLLNLVLNAMQAMPGGGELMVRTRRVRAPGNGDRVLVEVTDTGEGIPPDLVEQIWHVYFSRRKTGTGMGLPTARRFVEEHDGTIDVVSELGQGTSFTIRLPVPGSPAPGGPDDPASVREEG